MVVALPGIAGFAQATAAQAIVKWNDAPLLVAEGAGFGDAGDIGRSLELQLPVLALAYQRALGLAAEGQGLPVGGIAGGKWLQHVRGGCLQWQSQQQNQ